MKLAIRSGAQATERWWVTSSTQQSYVCKHVPQPIRVYLGVRGETKVWMNDEEKVWRTLAMLLNTWAVNKHIALSTCKPGACQWHYQCPGDCQTMTRPKSAPTLRMPERKNDRLAKNDWKMRWPTTTTTAATITLLLEKKMYQTQFYSSKDTDIRYQRRHHLYALSWWKTLDGSICQSFDVIFFVVSLSGFLNK